MVMIYDNGGVTAGRYLVHVVGGIYHMSANADEPGGVCDYEGPLTGSHEKFMRKHAAAGDFFVIPLDQAPGGVQRQVERLEKKEG